MYFIHICFNQQTSLSPYLFIVDFKDIVLKENFARLVYRYRFICSVASPFNKKCLKLNYLYNEQAMSTEIQFLGFNKLSKKFEPLWSPKEAKIKACPPKSEVETFMQCVTVHRG